MLLRLLLLGLLLLELLLLGLLLLGLLLLGLLLHELLLHGLLWSHAWSVARLVISHGQCQGLQTLLKSGGIGVLCQVICIVIERILKLLRHTWKFFVPLFVGIWPAAFQQNDDLLDHLVANVSVLNSGVPSFGGKLRSNEGSVLMSMHGLSQL